MNVEARVLSPRSRSLFKQAGLAWQRTPAGKHLPLADRHGRQPQVPTERPARRTAAQQSSPSTNDSDWQSALRQWARTALRQGARGLLDEASPTFERILLEAALEQAGGRKRDAAELLGWGRNTLARKLKELGMEEQTEED